MKKMSENAKALGVFSLILLVAFLIYFPGLFGGYLFDDQPNLSGLGYYAETGNWKDAWQFITSGFAGPTGRPISLLSFAFQADAWLNNPFAFKLVNLVIHLSCGLLLFYVTCLILRSYGFIEKKVIWIALFSTSIWLLHPLFVSTTLYVIQRMAQLPLLFSLLGMLGYFKAREYLSIRPLMAYVVMTLSIGLATILATYSKENGALLPLLILVIEFCNPTRVNKPVWYWRAICLWLPSLAIALLLFRYIDFSENPWPYRNFNQIERLWTEGRIICDYLYRLFIPQVEGYGLFQDGYVVSSGWQEPITTLTSAIFLGVLFLSALLLRKAYPLYALAILFFFSAHLIESTFIGLELYFEHRNYIAAIFLFLPLASGLWILSEKTQPRVALLIGGLVITIFSWMTWQRAILWSDNTKLQVYWAQNNPQSIRAQSRFAEILAARGRVEEANIVLEKAIKDHPDASLMIQLLEQKIDLDMNAQNDLANIKRRLIIQKADGTTIWALRSLVNKIVSNQKIVDLYALELSDLLKVLVEKNQSYRNYPDFYPLSMFMRGQLLIALGDMDAGYQAYINSALEYHNASSALALVADLGNKGYSQLALQLLTEMEQVYKEQLKNDATLDKNKDKMKKDLLTNSQLMNIEKKEQHKEM
ncbi:hypothetical protein [Acinetobacter bouvetii]|uniref:Tetratricopeptide repeat protein n=1 Tax=Acinetobacter bouvetii TaxID=202951 RepID=A0A811GB48_9GAMM|nr:hypothetical protein [Acinetobacter bouvetii]CAB1208107.1 hypothetical protein SFB21_0302 [Acinetobacter bouvetii]